MKWKRLLAIVIVVALIATISYRHWRANPYPPATKPPEIAAHVDRPMPHTGVITSLLPKRRSSAAPIKLPAFKANHDVQEFPGDLAKEAQSEAAAGNPDALRVLAQALRACSHANMASDDDIEHEVVRRSLGRELLRGNETRATPADDAAEAKRLEGIRDSCLQISKADSDQWLSWLEKSAAAGDSKARFELAWSLNEFSTQESREDNADEFIRRREEAFGYLQDSIANGDCSNPILNGFRAASPDPLTQYVYEGLLLQHALDDFSSGRFAPDYVNRESQSVNARLNYLASNVSVDQREQAQATIRDILQNYCLQF